mmetsp:Transcript_15212/g.32844  ORF Transcript_15212/g.32844 Transcript_15212/m.32844 type:complete len:571 (+) Transcript_15212:214-1926(+)
MHIMHRPPPCADGRRGASQPNVNGHSDNATCSKSSRSRQQQMLSFLCLASSLAILIFVFLGEQIRMPRPMEAKREAPAQHGNDGNPLLQLMVRGSGNGPSERTDQRRQYPAEVSLSTVGFLNGRKALEVGNRHRPHTDHEGNLLEWFVLSRPGQDYGVLRINGLDENNYRRQIFDPSDPDGSHGFIYPSYRIFPSYEENEKEQWKYYKLRDAMDDDFVRSEVYAQTNDYEECRVPNWHDLQFPTCNMFHEMTMINPQSDSRYLGRGTFRMAFSIQENDQPWYIVKVLRWKDEDDIFSLDRFEKTRIDALVMERLSLSPRIADMYGFCSTSVMTEPLPGEIEEEALPTPKRISRGDLHDKDDVDPKNPYTPTQKIEMALEMAEALADLHGFKDGIITHDDIDLGQFLRTPDGRLKLNDFNRAKVLWYDDVEEEYCNYDYTLLGGKRRAPEEYARASLNQSSDIYMLGNCFYQLLTGLWQYYDVDDSDARAKLVKGEMPYIDKRYRTRSYAEGKLVKAIEMCHKREPEDRADIFAIVRHLRAAVRQDKEPDRIENQRPALHVVKKYAQNAGA